jgi:hypothetical protein
VDSAGGISARFRGSPEAGASVFAPNGRCGKRVQQVEWGETATIRKTVAECVRGKSYCAPACRSPTLKSTSNRPPPLRLKQTQRGAFGRGRTDCIA